MGGVEAKVRLERGKERGKEGGRKEWGVELAPSSLGRRGDENEPSRTVGRKTGRREGSAHALRSSINAARKRKEGRKKMVRLDDLASVYLSSSFPLSSNASKRRTYLSGIEETVSGGLGEVDLEGELDGLGLGGGGLGGHGY